MASVQGCHWARMNPPGTGESPGPPTLDPQPHRVQDAAGSLELPGRGGRGGGFGDAGTAGERGHGTTRWQQHFASVSGACEEEEGAARAIPACPGPLPLSAVLPTCLKGGEERCLGGSQAQRQSRLGSSGFDVQKDIKGPSVSTLCLSFPTPAFTSPRGSPRLSLLHHAAAHLTGQTRARDLEKPTPGAPWRVPPPLQTLGQPCCLTELPHQL